MYVSSTVTPYMDPHTYVKESGWVGSVEWSVAGFRIKLGVDFNNVDSLC